MMKAHLSGIGFAAIFGFSFVFSKTVLSYLTPFGLLSIRFTLAWLLLEGLRRIKWIHVSINQETMKLATKVVLAQPLLYFTFENIGLSMVPSSLAGVLIALIPLLTLVFQTITIKSKINIIQLFWMSISLSGVILLTLLNTNPSSGSASLLGILLMIGAVISAAMFNLFSKSTTQHMSVMTLTYLMMMSGSLGFSVLHGLEVLFQRSPLHVFVLSNHITLLFPLLYLGLIASVGGFFLVNYTLSQISSAQASVYANLATVVSVIVGVVFLSESFGWWHALASALVIIGVKNSVQTSSS